MYKRVILKLSGEALSASDKSFDAKVLNNICEQVKLLSQLGVEIGIVVGGGNIMRGKASTDLLVERVARDNMGMLATVINSFAIQGTLESMGVDTRIMSAVDMRVFVEPYIRRRALRHFEKNRVVIFCAGTGSPFFSTDTLAALRASELNADVILMGKNGVDGVYSADPKIIKDAKKYDKLTYMQMIKENLAVMDTTATSMCMENNIDIVVFDINGDNNIVKAAKKEVNGTIISKE